MKEPVNGNIVILIALLGCIPVVMPITTTAQMCAGSDPLYSPQTVTTIGYPAMVTASECECTVIPGPNMKELISRVSLKREDQSSSCESHIFFTFHNSTYVFCPSDDVDSGVSFDAQFKQNDDRLFRFTLKNPNLILLSGAVEFTTNPASNYQIDCVNQGGSVWANSVQPVLDDIDGGIKVAIVLIILLLMVVFGYVFKRIWEKQRLQQELDRRKRRARQRKARQQRQKASRQSATSLNFENSGYSMTLETSGHTAHELQTNHVNSLAVVNVSLDESFHSRTKLPDWVNSMGVQNTKAGCGSIWPISQNSASNPSSTKEAPTKDSDNFSEATRSNRSSHQSSSVCFQLDEAAVCNNKSGNQPNLNKNRPMLEPKTESQQSIARDRPRTNGGILRNKPEAVSTDSINAVGSNKTATGNQQICDTLSGNQQTIARSRPRAAGNNFQNKPEIKNLSSNSSPASSAKITLKASDPFSETQI